MKVRATTTKVYTQWKIVANLERRATITSGVHAMQNELKFANKCDVY